MNVMISQPMNGLKDEEIAATRAKAAKVLEERGHMILNTYFTEEYFSYNGLQNAGVVQPPVYFLAKSIEAMSFCDAVYFCKGWEKARGCRIEHDVAIQYGLQIMEEE